MGKFDDKQLPVVQQQQSTFLRRRGAVCRLVNLKCAIILTLSVAALFLLYFASFLSSIATVQAYFRLHKPVSELIPQIARLEYDLNGEIGVPSSKVAILSMHQDDKSNWSNVVFGFLPSPIDITMNPVFLSLLRSSLTDLFLQQCNLTLSRSLFGDPSSFKILEFPGGITMIPERPAFIMHVTEALFCFTLDSSIHDIKENLVELKEQLNSGLHLMPNEVVYIQVTSNRGSTEDPPVTVKASVYPGLGALPQDRLKELALIVTGPAENLGLNHSVFGEVKEISLSSFLNHSLHAQTPIPSPSPAPSPGQLYGTGPSPTSSPPSLPDSRRSIPPCSNCYASTPAAAKKLIPPTHNLSRADSPESSEIHGSPHCGSPDPSISPPATYFNQISPSASSPAGPAPQIPSRVHYGPWRLVERNLKESVSSLHVLSSSSSSWSCALTVRWNLLVAVLAFLVICDPSDETERS